jgi:hypothetical protein
MGWRKSIAIECIFLNLGGATEKLFSAAQTCGAAAIELYK